MREFIETLCYPEPVVAEKRRHVRESLLAKADVIDGPNFSGFSTLDLENLVWLYDRHFFEHRIVLDWGELLRFDISRRLVRSAGNTRFKYADRSKKRLLTVTIQVSSSIIFSSFEDGTDSLEVGGIVCRNRMDALQCIVEHELIHLVEGVLYGNTSCSRPRFQDMARRIFGHTTNCHMLVTPAVRAYRKFGVRPGQMVAFEWEGRRLVGLVNRITRRATVLVENPRGARYSNGKRYFKFYVPPDKLTVIEDPEKRRAAGNS
ncbi:hypothetical protein JCM19992_32170 [Thermostilla marina]